RRPNHLPPRVLQMHPRGHRLSRRLIDCVDDKSPRVSREDNSAQRQPSHQRNQTEKPLHASTLARLRSTGLALLSLILTMPQDFRRREAADVAGKIEGTVVAYGPTGNLVTDIANDRLKGVPRGDSVKVICDEHETVGTYLA